MAGREPSNRHDLETTFDIRVFNIRRKQREKASTYEVRWRVAGRSRGRTFPTRAMADSFRSSLTSATNRGEAFDRESGLPVSALPPADPVTWWSWMLTYVDLKWPTLAPASRRSLSEVLVEATLVLSAERSNRPTRAEVRQAMNGWACNAPRRAAGPAPHEIAATVKWLERNTINLTALDDPKRTRALLDGLALKLDGTPAAATTIARRRAVVHNVFEFAVERELLTLNPLQRIRWRAPKVADAIDPRSVVNPKQAAALLEAVAAQSTGRRLVAFFGAIYYSALRPSEALALHIDDIIFPDPRDEEGDGWGEILVTRSNPDVSGAWSDRGKREPRQLKHRARGAVRRVPCPPQLVALFRAHIAEFCTSGSPRVFPGPQGADLKSVTYTKVWRKARVAALTKAQAESSLVRRPYDLRHAAVSTWLAAGVDSTQVAAWAGHSVQVLHRVYAHVLQGTEQNARRQIQHRLGQ